MKLSVSFKSSVLKKRNFYFIAAILIQSSVFCDKKNPTEDMKRTNLRKGISTIFIPGDYDHLGASSREIATDAYIPPAGECRANVLLLPGWSFPRNDWYLKTDILKEADKFQYCLLFPEMGKSLYEWDFFPETTRKIFPIPSGRWLVEIFIPYMQANHNILLKNQKNYLMGLSTGARGVALTALQTGKLFSAASALSGDYRQEVMSADRLMTSIYGPYEKYSRRWQTIDNPWFSAAKFSVPVYLAHGKQDKIVSFDQTSQFAERLKTQNPNLDVKFAPEETSGHDYKFWSSQIMPSFDFFSRH